MADIATVLDAVSRFHEQRHLSDFTIVHGGTEWPVHRFVLSIHSTALGEACMGPFEEDEENELDLSHYHHPAVQAFVTYLYTFEYDASNMNRPHAFHVEMCMIAKEFGIEGLKKLANGHFVTCMNTTSLNLENDITPCLRKIYRGGEYTAEIRKVVVEDIVGTLELETDTTTPFTRALDKLRDQFPEFDDDIFKEMRPKPARPIHPFFPTIVRLDDEKWYEIHCKLCGRNAEPTRKMFDGIEGLQEHVRSAHLHEARLKNKEQWISSRLCTQKDKAKMYRGETPKRPIMINDGTNQAVPSKAETSILRRAG